MTLVFCFRSLLFGDNVMNENLKPRVSSLMSLMYKELNI